MTLGSLHRLTQRHPERLLPFEAPSTRFLVQIAPEGGSSTQTKVLPEGPDLVASGLRREALPGALGIKLPN